jgi:hypothetical protein
LIDGCDDNAGSYVGFCAADARAANTADNDRIQPNSSLSAGFPTY